jgi:2-polyprenyl-3-methyl-5-hydroxy-6-metoxy-1,4-benzoquinol methylase
MEFERIADKKRVDFIITAIGAFSPKNYFVLDVGCGNGFISKAVADKGFSVTAIDANEKTINEARRLNPHQNVSYLVAGAHELETQPNRFDAIICSEVLEHLADPRSLLSVLHRCLREDGVLIVTVPNGRGPRELFVTRPVQYVLRQNNYLSRSLKKVKNMLGYTGQTQQSSAEDLTHLQFFTARSLKLLAARSGFAIQTIAKTNFIEQVFPVSLLTKKIKALQRFDCAVAEVLPLAFTSGFMSVWRKK